MYSKSLYSNTAKKRNVSSPGSNSYPLSPTSSISSGGAGSPSFVVKPKLKYGLKTPKKRMGKRRKKKRKKAGFDGIALFFCSVTCIMIGAMALMAFSLRNDAEHGGESADQNQIYREPGQLIKGIIRGNVDMPQLKAEIKADMESIGGKISKAEQASVKAMKDKLRHLNDVRKRLVHQQRHPEEIEKEKDEKPEAPKRLRGTTNKKIEDIHLEEDKIKSSNEKGEQGKEVLTKIEKNEDAKESKR